jgi:hypothetical protein
MPCKTYLSLSGSTEREKVYGAHQEQVQYTQNGRNS